MNAAKGKTTIIECPLSYSLNSESGQEIAGGEAKARLDEDHISIHPKSGKALTLSYRDISEFSGMDYRILIALTSNKTLTLFNVGFYYEDFLRELSRQRNEILLKDLLMHESLKPELRKAKVEADLIYLDENGKEIVKGECTPRLYETALVVIPKLGELRRVPYSDIQEILAEDYALTVTTEYGEKLIVSKMGRQFDPFKRNLSDAVNALLEKVQTTLRELVPQADSSVIGKAAYFMKEGRAAKRGDLESVSPGLWNELEKNIVSAGIGEEYDFLSSMAQKQKLCIGLKRGLMGDITGEYIWFLIPIYGTSPNEPGNAIAMEAGRITGSEAAEPGAEIPEGEGEKAEGKATYFFRITSRSDYPNFENIEDLHKVTDDFIKTFNRCMLAINFRREPIYLPEKKLNEPRYANYRFAISKIPALQILRNHFVGRVAHYSPEQWKEDVMELLRFNVSSLDDSAKWKKGEV